MLGDGASCPLADVIAIGSASADAFTMASSPAAFVGAILRTVAVLTLLLITSDADFLSCNTFAESTETEIRLLCDFWSEGVILECNELVDFCWSRCD
ncbi:unnamed protein product [Strongylus vulgaris]|uniref:Uncharacterized protein n=1 Tax=Strongylus vulgaris TaxID=40348 RepID=A0A3P7J472_STRVU|nr:unnamed protein product [Strongylus vulgaris]